MESKKRKLLEKLARELHKEYEEISFELFNGDLTHNKEWAILDQTVSRVRKLFF